MKPMNILALVTTAAAYGLLSNCASTERPITQSELAAQLRKLPAGEKRIALSVHLTTPGENHRPSPNS